MLGSASVVGNRKSQGQVLCLLLRMPHLRDGVSEKPLKGLLLRHPHVVHQVDLTRLRQRRRHGNVPVPNQVRRPKMARPPCDRAVQEHLAIRRRHGCGEGVERLGFERIRGVPFIGMGTYRIRVPWPGRPRRTRPVPSLLACADSPPSSHRSPGDRGVPSRWAGPQ